MPHLPIFFLFFLLLALIPLSMAFSFPSFPPGVGEIKFSGDAYASGDQAIELTRNQANGQISLSAGRAIYNNPITLNNPATGFVADFTTHFTFVIDALNKTNNGDGLAFFLAPVGSDLPINSSGGCLGLFSDTTNGCTTNQIVAVEFDTFPNSWDPSYVHMGIDVNLVNSSKTVYWLDSFAGNLNGEAWVVYNSSNATLSATLTYNKDNTSYKPDPLSLSLAINLTQVLPQVVVVGFSASTGASTEVHRILTWNFTSTIPTPSPAPAPNPIQTKSTPDPTNRIPKWAIALVTCLVALFLGTVATTLIVIWRRKNEKMKEEEEVEDDGVEVTMDFKTGPRRFSYGELAAATNNFSEEGKLGQGGFGGVYRGVLRDTHEAVAVKRFSKGSTQGKKEYVSEVTVISRLRHRNLVRLIGWCHERREFLLVYECMEGGSLDSHLFGLKDGPVMPWERRTRVALGVASAVLYLHEEWEQCVVHRDIKSSNVMIDSEFNARLGDFGLARLVDHGFAPQTTVVAGTMGYLAPECVITGKASRESDVYSFGIVLLEIACGRRAFGPIGEQEVRLVEWVWAIYGAGALVESIDGRLGSEFEHREAECMMVVGLWCTHPDPGRRPTMREAIQVLTFQAELPSLPPKMPVPVFFAPSTLEVGFDSGFSTSSSGGITTTTTTSTMESSTKSLLRSYTEEVGSLGESGD